MIYGWIVGIGGAIAGAVAALLFRKNGPYNPPELPPVPPPETPHETPVKPPPSPPAHQDRVLTMALAQKAFEGWAGPGEKCAGKVWPKGTPAFQCNNPGNIRDIHGQEIHYPTPEAGLAALQLYIRNVAIGKHKAYPKGGNTTLYEYTHIYTGDQEPAPTNYAYALSTALDVPVTTPISYVLG